MRELRSCSTQCDCCPLHCVVRELRSCSTQCDCYPLHYVKELRSSSTHCDCCPLHYVVRELGSEHVVHSADGSINMGDSVLIKVSGSEDEIEKDVLVSWSLQVLPLLYRYMNRANPTC